MERDAQSLGHPLGLGDVSPNVVRGAASLPWAPSHLRYKPAFDLISRQRKIIFELDLRLISPALLGARDLELAIPGTYAPGAPVVRIARFEGSMNVIVSKQAPRKLSLFGDDGVEYCFLLKAKEDLRQACAPAPYLLRTRTRTQNVGLLSVRQPPQVGYRCWWDNNFRLFN